MNKFVLFNVLNLHGSPVCSWFPPSSPLPVADDIIVADGHDDDVIVADVSKQVSVP